MSFKIEIANSSDEIQKLYKIIYPEKDCSKFDWLYNQNPLGKADMFVARDDTTNQVIGAYVIIPMLLSIHGQPALTGQAIDGMVHPDYRGKHLFNRLVAEVFEKVKSKYKYLIGFPNNMSRGSLIKAGWIEMGEFVTWSLPLQPKAVLGSVSKIPLIGSIANVLAKPLLSLYRMYYASKFRLHDIELKPLDNDSFEIESTQLSISKINPVMTVRDIDFIRWRLLTVPKENYQTLVFKRDNDFLGYISYKITQHSAEIVDFIISPEPENIKAAISLFIDHCQKEKCKAIHFQLSENAYCCDSFRACGFIKRKTDHAIIVYPFDNQMQEIDYSDCYICLADTDWI